MRAARVSAIAPLSTMQRSYKCTYASTYLPTQLDAASAMARLAACENVSCKAYASKLPRGAERTATSLAAPLIPG